MKHDTIRDLQSDPRIYGDCCHCGESFKLKDAKLFYADEPWPELAQEVVRRTREELAEKRRELALDIKKVTQGAGEKSIDVNLGQVLEKVAPILENFGCRPRDCRPLFDPIDYVVFNGLSDRGVVDSLVFLDVKTGKASLQPNQKMVRDALENGRVTWETYE